MTDSRSTSERLPLKERTAKDFTASVVVFLVALPLCMGVAIASGAPVAAGLITGMVGGLIAAPLAGCQLQVSGPAAGLTVIVYEAIQEFGLEMLGPIVLIAGVAQVAAALCRLGGWFRAVSPAVINGMLAGIGVLIFASQFHVMVDDKPKDGGLANLATIPEAIVKAFAFPQLDARDVRRAETQLLVQVGELHRRQVNLYETAAERAPHHEVEIWKNDPESAPDLEFADLAERQDALRTAVAEAREAFNEYASEAGDAEQIAAVRENFDELQDAVEQAHAALVSEVPHDVLSSQELAAASFEGVLASQKNHHLAAQVGILTIAVLLLWQGFAPRRLRVIPGPLAAIVLATAVAAGFVLPVLYVEIPDQLTSSVHYFRPSLLQDAPWGALLQTGLLVAAVASAETLLCATAVDQMHHGPRTKYDRELFAQGAGNTLCGLLGALPMTGVIVRSSANVHAGGQSRLSAFLHGVWLLLFVAVLAGVLRLVPTSALAAVLVYTGYKLVNVKAIKELAKYGWSEVAIYAVTVIVIVVEDLLVGVLVGLALAAAKLFFIFSRLRVRLETTPGADKAVLHLDGAATFVRLPLLAAELENAPRGVELHVEFERLSLIDHACLQLLMNWAKQHRASGGKLVIDWESLQARVAPDMRGSLKLSPPESDAAPQEKAGVAD